MNSTIKSVNIETKTSSLGILCYKDSVISTTSLACVVSLKLVKYPAEVPLRVSRVSVECPWCVLDCLLDCCRERVLDDIPLT